MTQGKVYAILMIQLLVTLSIVALFTFCAVFFVTYITLVCCPGPSYYNTKSVVMCLGITAMVCLTVTLVSFQTKVPWVHGVYGALGALLFTMFLAFDTQLLMGNKRYTISPEEYVFATLNIYLDIIYIFSFFLSLFGTERTN
ncbi:unnamed protein product [Coregonus sp. 'balchen']|nr:unnamed protein product [Coregonus sp. 'balchen']